MAGQAQTRIRILLIGLTLMLLPLTAQPQSHLPATQPHDPQAPLDDPMDAASHGVARVSLLNGAVTTARGDSGNAANSMLNEPLVTGDRIVTGDDGRVELQFDAIDALRIASRSEVRMGDLQYHHSLVQIAQGLVTLSIARDLDAGSSVEISLPNSSIKPLRQGTYRVLVRPDGSSEITVRAGDAEVFSVTGSERLQVGTTLLSRGPIGDPEFMTVTAAAPDDWDRWNFERDRSQERLADNSRRSAEISPDVNGTEELNNYGRWTQDQQYGSVWVPNVPPDWAPYRDGQWNYLDYYGWTWVSYDPWGWAPYHYGGWFRGAFGWAWYPGGRGPHHWRPALVGFVGWGSPGFGSSFGFGFGHIGWVPLGPREPFRPWYGRGFGSFNAVVMNRTGSTIGAFQNARYTNAITGIGAGEFGRSNLFLRPSSDEVARGGVVSGVNTLMRPRSVNTGASVSGLSVHANYANSRFYRAPQQTPVSSADGWRRFTPQPRIGQQGFGQQGQNPQTVQINPPIVNNNSGRMDGNSGRMDGAMTNGSPNNNSSVRYFGGPAPPANQPQNGEGFGGPRYIPRPPGPPQVYRQPLPPSSNSQPANPAGNRGRGERAGGARGGGTNAGQR